MVIDNQHQVVLPQLVEVGQQVAKHLLGELQHHRDDPENAVVTEGNVENDDTENNKEQVSNDTLKEQLYGDESAVKLEPYAISS